MATSSALNPTLLLAGICSPISFFLSYQSTDALRYLLFLAGLAPVAVALWQIVRFTNSDPDRLQNDRHVENKMLIGLFGDKANGDAREILLKSGGPLIENPELRGGGK